MRPSREWRSPPRPSAPVPRNETTGTLRGMFDTDRRGGWLWWLVLGVATAGVLAYLFSAHERSLAGTVIQAVAAVVALVASIAGWLWRRQRTRRALPTVDGLDRAADALAVAVR